jgi:CHAT domain-containing protein/Tfp pilus assembly protein PilF
LARDPASLDMLCRKGDSMKNAVKSKTTGKRRGRVRWASAWGAVAVGVAVLAGVPRDASGQGAEDAVGVLAEARQLHSEAAKLYREGKYDAAIPLAERAIAIREKALGPEHPLVAASLNNLGGLYYEKADYARAEPLYRRALAIREKALGPEHPLVAGSLNNLAGLYHEKGIFAPAEPLYRRALAIWEKALGPEHPNVADSLDNLAGLYGRKGDYARAEPLHRRALAIREKALGPGHPAVAGSLNGLASLYMARRDTKEATRALAHTMVVEDRNLAALLTTGSDEQKRAYMARRRGTTDRVVALHVQLARNARHAKRLALTAILRRKGRVLDAMADSFEALRRHGTPAAQADLDQLKSVSAQYSALVWRGPGTMPLDVYRTTLARLDEERQALEDKVSRSSAKLSAGLRPIFLERVQAAIPEGAALVEWFRYEPFKIAGKRASSPSEARYVAYVLRREGEIAWVDLGDAAPIEAAVKALRNKLRRAATNPEPAARSLYALVMAPVRRLLGDTRWIFLSPDGALNLVPFGALRDEDNEYLVDHYSFTYLTSGRDLIGLRATTRPRERPVVLAGPDFDGEPEAEAAPAAEPATGTATVEEGRRSAHMGVGEWTGLPFAAQEGRALRQLLPDANLLTGAAATEGAVKALHGPRILHIATHGFFLPDQPEQRALSFNDMTSPALRGGAPRALYAENPLLRSGLVFAGANRGQNSKEDGVLTALEASQLDLTGTKLVVLSACDTAVGDVQNGEGVYGLRRALAIAGAETQVMSLWQVGDAATREQMQAYYGRLLQGDGRSEAMRQVHLALRNAPQRSHPHYWASFIVSGNPAALDGKAAPPDFARVTPGMRGCGCEVGGRGRDTTAAWLLSTALAWTRLRRRRPQ